MKEFIYIAIDEKHGFVKIGRSKNPKARFISIKTSNPFVKKMLIHELPFWCEQVLHDFFSSRKIENEWFDFNDFKIDSLSFVKCVALELKPIMAELHKQVEILKHIPTQKTREKNRNNKQVYCLRAIDKLSYKLHY